jgi:hypothetical protein
LDIFFPPGAAVLALPNWRSPRLILPTHDAAQRWKLSSLYPASRPTARAYRLFVRAKAAAKLGKVRKIHSEVWPLQEFTQDVLPGLTFAVILMRASDPAQRITAQLWNEKGRVAGYLRYAEKEVARRRLQQECLLLSRLPGGLGPEPLKCGLLGDGEALLKTALTGKPLGMRPPPPEELVGLLDTLVVADPMPIECHPWVRRLRARAIVDIDGWLEPLASLNWPVTLQHGDLAPWNLLRGPEGRLQILDWEYGSLEGFPYVDLVHYILQTSALIYRRDPSKATREAMNYLISRRPKGPDLNEVQAHSLVRLAAFEAYLQTSEDGQNDQAYLQTWRRKIWSKGGRGLAQTG